MMEFKHNELSPKDFFRNVSNLFKQPEKRNYFTSAVIVAGGVGKRTGLELPKQHVLLCGRPAVTYTLEAFEKSHAISEIVVVCLEGEERLYRNYAEKYGISKLSRVVCGGKTRQESSRIGVEAVNAECEFVAIHDAARCLITTEDIEKTVRTAYRYNASVAAVRANDTVKIADPDGFVGRTPDRNRVYLAQTPQVMKHDIYEAAVRLAQRDGYTGTDDSSLAERLGYKVKICVTEFPNFKITTASDIVAAEAILKKRCNGES